jgi:predicted nucleic acid-binding protein
VHRKWVLNSSPLIILGKLSSLYLFERMCPNLVIPEGVAHELDQGPVKDPARAWTHREGAPFVRNLDKIPPLIQAWDLGKGETEVISWAYVHPDYQAVLDDRAARNCAFSLGIQAIGTLGVILLAKKDGVLSQVKPLITRLLELGFRITPELLATAYRLADEE